MHDIRLYTEYISIIYYPYSEYIQSDSLNIINTFSSSIMQLYNQNLIFVILYFQIIILLKK